jgi:hypothetical protein
MGLQVYIYKEKKMIYRVFIVIFILFMVFTPPLMAVNKTAQTGLQFLKVDVGARAAAMGGSYYLIGTDASAMFYNPAGLARMQSNVDVFIANTQWIAGIEYYAGGIAKNLGKWGSIGISYAAGSYGDDIMGTRYDPTTEQGYELTGKLDMSAYAFGISYAKSMTEKFTIGGQVKYAYQQLGENLLSSGEVEKNDVSGLAFDFGTVFYPGFKSFRFGMSIRNFSPEFKYVEEGFELPLTFSIGVAMNLLDLMGDEYGSSLLFSVDALHPRDYSERINMGLEYTVLEMFSLRAGYKFNYDIESFTAGVGFNKDFGNVIIDLGYAYSEMEFFDAVNRISFRLSF